MDINTRKYGASFGLVKWRYETAGDRVVFDGPEFSVLNNRDIAHDMTATAIENCNWFQVRQYITTQELQNVNDQRSKPIYKNLDKLKYALKTEEAADKNRAGGDGRGTNWQSRNRTISGLETDPYGKDPVFKTIEIITEYRRDRWITFAPKYNVILRDIENPYGNHELPIVMLRYYAIDDDLYGVSEIEPVKGLQKAINALLCQYVDEVNQKLYSPIAIGPGVRQHTLEWGKGARWIMNNPMSDFRVVESQSAAAQYFNNTYSVLVSSMMTALGESSLGVSNIQPFQKDKTATEVKALQIQRNARDNYNQIFLSEAIKRQYMLWHTMNQKLLFTDPTKKQYIIRISGADALRYFSQVGLDAESDESETEDAFMQEQLQNAMDGKAPLPQDVAGVVQGAKSYQYPVNTGTEDAPVFKPKMQTERGGEGATIMLEPEDLKGNYDFIIDVESMTASANEEKKQARQQAIQAITSNPMIVQLLAQEGVKPKFKELFVTWLEDLGFGDARRFFEKAEQGGGAGGPAGPQGGANPIAAMMGGGVAPQPAAGTPQAPPMEMPPAEGQPTINTGTVTPEKLAALFQPKP